jgi:uncharacterized protein (TIGR02145 family)
MIKEKSYGPNQLARMFEGNPNMQKVIWSLWREYYGLYLEKYKKKPEYDDEGNLVDPWLLNKISDDISYALALGQDNDMNGNRSFALGQGLVTKSFMEIVLGAYNLIPEGQNAEEWIPTDLLLTLGNGPDKDHRSNVFEIFKNGFFKFLSSIKIGAAPELAEGETRENGTLQWTPENGLEEWDTDHWKSVVSNTTIIDDRDSITNIIENHVYYETTTQEFIIYINNNWVSLDQQPETIYPESENQTANGKHTHKFNAGKLVTQPTHSFTFGTCIKRNGSGAWIPSKANTRQNAGTVGIVSEVIDSDHFRYITGGLLPGNFVDGAYYWLSTTTAGAIFIQSDPEVWEIGNVREFIGTGTANGLEIEIDLGDEITEFDFGGGGAGASNDVVSGDGMDFETNMPVTLGLPSTIDSTTKNAVTEHSHTHELGNVDISSISKANGYGALYNKWAIDDERNILIEGWHIPTNEEFDTLINYCGGEIIAGTKLKEKNSERWNQQIYEPTNETGFTAVGAGFRETSMDISDFVNLNTSTYLWSSTPQDPEFPNTGYGLWMAYNTEEASYQYSILSFNIGASVRPIKDSTTLTNGQSGTYVGNDGKVYRTICIGTQEWLAENINETKFRNGDWIHGFDGGVYSPIIGEDWVALITDGMCYYDDNEANGGGRIPLSEILNEPHNSLWGLQGGDHENDEFYHLTEQQFNDINDSPPIKSASSTASGTNLNTQIIQNIVLPSSPCEVRYAELAWVLFGGNDYSIQQDMGKTTIIIDYDDNGNPNIAYKHTIPPTHPRINSVTCSINYDENSWKINSLTIDFDCVGDNLPYRFVIQGFYVNN